jgi:hypothetical protein
MAHQTTIVIIEIDDLLPTIRDAERAREDARGQRGTSIGRAAANCRTTSASAGMTGPG